MNDTRNGVTQKLANEGSLTIKKTDDKGQYPESTVQLKATYGLWKDKPIFSKAKVNPEYDQFKKK